jgi:uncharacterized RmlC-like cupin family protein
MADEEASRWRAGDLQADFYARKLASSLRRFEEMPTSKQVVKPVEMPWEDSPQGRLKHVLNAGMDTAATSMDIYIQEIPPGGRSGKHWHVAEEMVFILEGRGHDLHWDVNPDVKERYQWKISEEASRHDWEEGCVVFIPSCVAHQHFNNDPQRPARIICARNRVYDAVGWELTEQLEPAPGYEG